MNSEDVRALIDELNGTINWLKRTGSLHDADRVQRAVTALEASAVAPAKPFDTSTEPVKNGADSSQVAAVSSPSMRVEDVLREHRIVGVSGYGIEEVMCACQHNGWTGGGKWHPAAWHPKHVAKKLAKLAAVSSPPTITDDEAIAIAFAKSDDMNHEDLCHCRQWPESCVTYGDRRTWTHNAEFVARAALAAALHPGGETNGN